MPEQHLDLTESIDAVRSINLMNLRRYIDRLSAEGRDDSFVLRYVAREANAQVREDDADGRKHLT